MTIVLLILLVLTLAGVLGVLFVGVFGVIRGGGDPRRSNVLMRWRVALQAAALLIFILLMSLLHH